MWWENPGLPMKKNVTYNTKEKKRVLSAVETLFVVAFTQFIPISEKFSLCLDLILFEKIYFCLFCENIFFQMYKNIC